MAVFILYTTLASIFATSTSIHGYSQWSKLLLKDNQEHWDFINDTRNTYENHLKYNCGDVQWDTTKCPTYLTLLPEKDDNTGEYVSRPFPQNLFVYGFSRLEFLNVSNYVIAEISSNHFANAVHLIHLDLSRNQIAKLPRNLFEFAPNVEYIDLSYNELTNHGIDEHAFGKCASLKQLNLSNNKISEISDYRNWPIPMTNLEVLILNANNIFLERTVFLNSRNLVSIYARNCRIYDWLHSDDMYPHYLPKLKKFIISEFTQYRGYETSVQKYSDIILDTETAIIDVSGYMIRKLNADILRNFQIIIANDNSIRSIECPTDSKVTEIYVSHNPLSDIDFVENMPLLAIADFSNNELLVINETMLKSLMYLRELNLARNFLQTLDLGIMQQIPKLKALNLSHNLNFKGELKLNTNTSIEIFNTICTGLSVGELSTKSNEHCWQ